MLIDIRMDMRIGMPMDMRMNMRMSHVCSHVYGHVCWHVYGHACRHVHRRLHGHAYGLYRHSYMCIGICGMDVCTDVVANMDIGVYIDRCNSTAQYTPVCIGMCIGMCVGMCIGMCVGMCLDMCVYTVVYTYSRLRNSSLHQPLSAVTALPRPPVHSLTY